MLPRLEMIVHLPVTSQLCVEFFEYSEVYAGVNRFLKKYRANNVVVRYHAPHTHLLCMHRLLVMHRREMSWYQYLVFYEFTYPEISNHASPLIKEGTGSKRPSTII